MELIPADTRFDFIGKRKICLVISTITILISFGSIFLHGGLKYGVDFAGGILLQIKFSNQSIFQKSEMPWKPWVQRMRMVQKFGGENEFLIRIEKSFRGFGNPVKKDANITPGKI